MSWLFSIFVLVFLGGCNSPDTSYLDSAKQYCIEQNGTIITIDDEILCQYAESVLYDEGSSIVQQQCEVKSYYEDKCYENESVDPESNDTHEGGLLLGDAPPMLGDTPQPIGANELLDNRVKDILNHLDNTGYSHNRNSNFSLSPSPSDFDSPTQTYGAYNLFLDCSGFVGYYVLQSIDQRLYDAIPKGHSCSSRPLAADFADTFRDKHTIFTEATIEDIEQNNTCWGRVLNLKDAKAGDIIVYAHTEDLTDEVECRDGHTVIKGTCTKYKDESNETCLSRKNTGHILFVTGNPYRSGECQDRDKNKRYCKDHKEDYPDDYPKKYQWVVPIADSTTYPHTRDSRGGGDFKGIQSKYKDNDYIAWNRGNYKKTTKYPDREYDLERCEDSESNMTFHRHCEDDYGMNKLEEIIIHTGYEKRPTGIGAGKMYVNDAMDGFRSRYGVEIERADVYIGRMVKCEE